MSNNVMTDTPTVLDLIQLLVLERIIVPRLDFCLEEGCSLPVARYKSNISRSSSELNVTDNRVTVSFGFEVKGITEDKPLFTGHFHYNIVYKHNDMPRISALLENENVKGQFLVAQSDKLVWSYFRKTLQDMVVDAGLPPLVLPLYR